MNENVAIYKIGVISDTHGLLRPEIEEQLKSCNVILHAGDIDRSKVLEALNEIAPVYAVRGNADRDWAEHIPTTRKEDLFGLRIFMIHNKKQISEDIADCDIVIYGHSHKYEERFPVQESLPGQSAEKYRQMNPSERQQCMDSTKRQQCKNSAGGRLWLNPGSCGPRRFSLPVTMAIIETDGSGNYKIHRIDIPHRGTVEQGKSSEHPNRKQNHEAGYPESHRLDAIGAASENGMEREIKKINGDLINSVIRDIIAGKSVSVIAKKNKLSPELAEHICRLYLTHPGLDAEGILDKMDIHNK